MTPDVEVYQRPSSIVWGGPYDWYVKQGTWVLRPRVMFEWEISDGSGNVIMVGKSEVEK